MGFQELLGTYTEKLTRGGRTVYWCPQHQGHKPVNAMDNLPPTIDDFIEYVEGTSPSKDQIIEWAKELGAAEDCARCHSEPVVDLDDFQARLMEHYDVPDERSNEIYNVLMRLPGMGISTDGIFCDHCNRDNE